MFVINNRTDAIMLGIMQGNESVGLYNVANRGAMLISFILVAVNQSLAPSIAKLYAEGNLSKLQSIITKSSRTIIFGSLPIALILIIFGKWFLLIFGSEFTAAYLTLVILSFGQLINATMGSVGLLLDMTGHERDTAVGVGTTAILNIILNALFIPIWGVNGAAIATAISTIAWNIILFFYVKKRLGITPSIVFG
jgi:O-antigen/teichoic acid export membrane protein